MSACGSARQSGRMQIWMALCLLGLLLPFSAGLQIAYSGWLPWLIDLATHWQWLFLPVFLVLSCVAARRDRRYLIGLATAALPWLSASAQLESSQPASTMLSVASANVHWRSADIAPLARWVAAEQPDVLVVLEVSPAYGRALAAKLNDYPHRHIVADGGPFGIALLSRYPITILSVVRDADGIPRIDATLQLGTQRINLVAMHPMPPISMHFHASRNRGLAAATARAQQDALPGMVVGDLNATPWSSPLIAAERQGLRRAGGMAPTWPAEARGIFGIPIDHVLASAHWRLVQHKVGPQLGSDHLPVLVRLALPGAHINRDVRSASE